jgi:ribosomal protein S27AE
MQVRDLLSSNQHLNIWCAAPGCRHKVRWTAVQACERLGPETPIAEARRRLRCGRCGARGRDGHLDAHPCTLDAAAAFARQQHAAAAARGEDLPWPLDETLAHLQGLIFEAEGDLVLGGDGPVDWPGP